jgi:tRNA(Arg) A34 adenosine deaminase TadA
MLKLAAKAALPTDENDARNFLVGAAGRRADGATVFARNGATFSSEIESYRTIPQAHAEVRLLRKLGVGGTVWVARVSRKDGGLVMARPCDMCQVFLRSKRVRKAYYSVSECQYGILYPMDDIDCVFSF